MTFVGRAWLFWSGAALILVVNAIVLAGAGYNRSGGPHAVIELSERELGLPYYWQHGSREENSGLALQLAWRVGARADAESEVASDPDSYQRRIDWLDAEKLRDLGFDIPEQDPLSEQWKRGDRALPRAVWLLLEFDAGSYQRRLREAERWLEHLRLSGSTNASSAVDSSASAISLAEQALTREREQASRLFVIDADLDPAALRSRYPDASRHLIVRGRIRAGWNRLPGRKVPEYRGHVEAVEIESLHVSTRLRPLFDGLDANTRDGAPRYVVTLSYGRRHEPWIIDAAPAR